MKINTDYLAVSELGKINTASLHSTFTLGAVVNIALVLKPIACSQGYKSINNIKQDDLKLDKICFPLHLVGGSD